MPNAYYEVPDDIAVFSVPVKGYLYSKTADECGVYRIIGMAPPEAVAEAEEEATGLYRLFNADKRLLYVGISSNPGMRWEQHSKDKAWWHQVDGHTVHWFRCRPEAETAERAAIQAERPLYNRMHAAPDAFDEDWWASARIDRHARESLSGQIARLISRAVKDGLLRPGSRLLTASRMAAHLGVSTSVVVIAMKRLREQGIVARQRGVGLYVASPQRTVSGPLDCD